MEQYYLQRQREEEVAISNFLTAIDTTTAPRYEDRDEVVLDCFQTLSSNDQQLVIRALVNRM